MRIYLMTDLEGVAGVRNFEEWTHPDARYYDTARALLTEEVNAAVDGFFMGGAAAVLVADGHGPGAVDITRLDSRADLLRGWGRGWPLGLEEDAFDAVAWVGQHAKSRTPFSNMAHTQSCAYLEISVNGVAIGEFGQLAFCAGERGIRAIFAAGELAFTREASALVPGIETVAVKRGTVPGRGDECTREQYAKRNHGAIHMHPERARQRIREGACRAIQRARGEEFGLLRLEPPYTRTVVMRASREFPYPRWAVDAHPNSVAALMNQPMRFQAVSAPGMLAKLLVD